LAFLYVSPVARAQDLDSQIKEALRLNGLERLEEARSLLLALAASHPADVAPLEALGNILRTRGRFAEAAGQYSAALERLPKPSAPNWTLYYARGICYERLGNWDLAEPDLLKAINLSNEHPLPLNYLGYSWIERGKNLKQAMAYIKKAVQLQPNDGYMVDSLGWANLKLGNIGEAVRYLERAVELQPNDATIADHLGDAYLRLGRVTDARGQWQKALSHSPDNGLSERIRVKLAANGDPTHHSKATSGAVRTHRGDTEARRQIAQLSKRMGVLRTAGKYVELITLAEQFLQRVEEEFGKTHVMTGGALFNLADSVEIQNRYAEAEAYYKRALAIFESTPDETQRVYSGLQPALVLAGLADVYAQQGRYAEAESLYTRSLSFRDQAWKAHVLVSLADLHKSEGNYGEAERFYRNALAILEQHPTTEGRGVLPRVLNDIAGLYLAQSRLNEAEAFSKRALTALEEAYGPKHPNLANGQLTLATIYETQSRSADAEPLYKRAIAILEETVGPSSRSLANALMGLAHFYQEQRRYAEAEPLFKRTLAIYQTDLSDSTVVAEVLSRLGFFYHTLGRDSEAEPFFRRALAMDERVLPPNHPNLAVALANLAALELRQNRNSDSLATIRRATTILEQRRAPMSRSADATNLNNNWFFTHHVRAAFRVAESDKTLTIDLMKEGFRVGQWASAARAAGALSQMSARFSTGDTALAQVVREQQDLEAQWQAMDRALTNALSLPPERREGADEHARTRLAEIDVRAAALNARLKQDFPQYFALVRGEPVTMDEVAALLDHDEGLLQYVFANEESFAWLVTRNTQRWVRIARPWDALVRDIAAMDCGLDSSNWDDDNSREHCRDLVGSVPENARPLPFDLAKAHELYELLLEPFASEIKGKRLIIVAPSPLSKLPFGTLVTTQRSLALPKTAEGYQNVDWLGTQNAITVLPSVSSLQTLRKLAKAGEHAPEPFIGFGDPTLRGNPSCGTSLVPSTCPGPVGKAQRVATLFRGTAPRSPLRSLTRATMQSAFKGNLANVDVLQAQCPLPETSFELKCVAQSLGVPESQIQLREKATEAAVKKTPLDRYRIVYFATHGLLASETQWATGSIAEPALILTPPQVPSDADDGLLTASEITQLKLNADWVVLSACNTAGADDTSSGEALSGLARAFFYAGARALLVSYWAVDSEAAVLLTTRTFAELQQNPTIGRAEALRRSIQAVIENNSHPDAAHPSFWAPFTVVGEGSR
jgi:CHAT domain-containing protein/tetratricopeptide (TPR) repeat protein